jgi:predicted small secreted protein
MKTTFKTVLTGLLLLSLGFMYGCHTVKGFGKDIEQSGKTIERVSGH